MIGRIIITIIVITVFIIPAYLIYEEQRPEHQPYIVDKGIVDDSGCVTSKYKSHNVYDCSVDVDFVEAGEQRIVIRFGVLPGDKINKVCQVPVGKEMWCYYERGK